MNRDHRNLFAAAGIATAVVALLSSCAAGLAASPSSAPTAPTSGAVTTPSVTPTTSPTTTVHGSACTTGDLTAYLPEPGDAAGTEIAPILFRNVSTTPCWFGGVPTLFGITADGTVTKLPFRGTANPGSALQPAQGPGDLAPGEQGIVKAAMQLNNCPVPPSVYQAFRTLRIQFPTGAIIPIPYPKPLAVTSCPAGLSEAGLGTQ